MKFPAIPHVTRKRIPECPSSLIFCGCWGVCSQTSCLYTDAELLAKGYDPATRPEGEESPRCTRD